MRQLSRNGCKWISTRRLVEDRMSTGLTNTHTARGFSDLHHVFARKQCIICSALRHKCCLTLLYVSSIQDFFCPWNNRARCCYWYKSQNNDQKFNLLEIKESSLSVIKPSVSWANLVYPKYKRKTEGGRTFTIRTIKDWNYMNANIRNNGSLANFKHNVFKSFLAKQKAAMLLRL